jgi:uncharacterized repeat protein (TIGR03843 family)
MTERPADPASDLRAPAGDDEARTLLLEGEIDLEGRMLDASNVTLVGTIRTGELEAEWIDGDVGVDLAAFVRSDHPGLRRMAVFDAVVNNADRKGGHIIPTPDGHVYGVDHGICFSVDPKLRTLLWRWAGQPLPAEAVEVLEKLTADLLGDLGEQLHEHLTRREVRRTQQRVAELLRTGRHPLPSGDWPALPWPPF